MKRAGGAMHNRRDAAAAFAGSAFGFGRAPIAPGTAGTLPAVAVYLAVALLVPAAYHTWIIAFALILSSAGAVLLAPSAQRYWGKSDPGAFVLDEVAGFFLTVLFFRTPNVWLTVVWAFAMTRFFDILKPPPVRAIEKLPRGWGVLADDLAASVYAVILLKLIARFFPTIVGGGVTLFG